MATFYDFVITTDCGADGKAVVVAQNEDAFTYITEEGDFNYRPDGSVLLTTDQVGDFISDCGWEKFSCELV